MADSREDDFFYLVEPKMRGILPLDGLHISKSMGDAHSVEVWDKGVLVGGLYGVTQGGAFFGESMFSKQTNASKLALIKLVEHLNQRGFTLLDTQFLTDHLKSMGATELPQAKYLEKLNIALQSHVRFA